MFAVKNRILLYRILYLQSIFVLETKLPVQKRSAKKRIR